MKRITFLIFIILFCFSQVAYADYFRDLDLQTSGNTIVLKGVYVLEDHQGRGCNVRIKAILYDEKDRIVASRSRAFDNGGLSAYIHFEMEFEGIGQFSRYGVESFNRRCR